MDRPTEHDLLALIEGELPPERVPVVEAALRADPGLVDRIRKLKDDRAALVSLGAGDRAPEGVVDDAMAKAQQNEMMQVDTGGPVDSASLSRGSRGRRVQMGVAAAVGLSLMGVWVWLMLTVSSPNGQLTPVEHRPVKLAHDDDDTAVGPEAPSDVPPPAPTLAEVAKELELGTPEKSSKDQGKDELLDEWLANIRTSGEPDGGAPGPDQTIDYRHAAELALQGRLRIRVDSTDPGGFILADGSRGADALQSYDTMHAQGGPSDDQWRIELRYRTDTATTDLALALQRMVDELEARTGHRVRLEPAEAPEPDAEATPTPIVEAASVLWWDEPSSGWARCMAVRPLVTFKPDRPTN